MKMKPMALILIAVLFSFLSGAQGAEYFVSKQGADANNGTNRDTAFATIQKGVNALQPGDTLTIGPGEYSENVLRANLGNMDVDTIIRAELPGTTVLRGDIPAPEFKKVGGYRFVYAAPLDQEPEAVLEHGAMAILEKKPNVFELEFEPGAIFYDAKAKMLYMSTTSQQPPQSLHFTLVQSGKSGLQLDNPKRVIIEGLSATGFHRTMTRRPGQWIADYQWGIVLDQPTSCTIRNCYTYMNCGGIALNKGRGNIVEDCVAHNNAQSNIQYYGGENHADNIVRNCNAYQAHEGIDSYGILTGPMLFQNNIAWGHSLDYSNKSGDASASEFGFMEGCVALSDIRVANMKNCIFGGKGNEYNREESYASDNIIFAQEKNLDIGREFADPINMDWRLQADSRFVGAREDGKDRGLYPDHDYTIYFLTPKGNDANDGTSLGKAWQTLACATKNLKPGDTLYLSEGTYPTQGPITLGHGDKEKIRICARGRDRVIIEGNLNMTGTAGVELERIAFSKNTSVKDSHQISFNNCTFSGLSATKVKGLSLTHGLFTRAPLKLEGSSDVYLSGNIFANTKSPAVIAEGATGILYSDYNSYENGEQCWQTAGKTTSLDKLRRRHDRYSILLKPEIAAEGHAPQLTNSDIFAGRGPRGTSLGQHIKYEEVKPSLIGPFLHSVTDTTANIEWWTSVPATCEVVWGATPAMEHSAKRTNEYRFTTFSLTGLKPGQKYYFAIRTVDATTAAATPLPMLQPKDASLTFCTSADATIPVAYYVAPDGNDANAGRTRNQALRSISRAAAMVNAGDTVLIVSGTYNEFVRVRATGVEGKPITFKAIPGEKVVMNGSGRSLSQAMTIFNKDQIRIDGIYITRYAGPGIYMYKADNVQITRCFANGEGPGYAGPLAGAKECANLLVRNCIMTSGMGSGLNINYCPDVVIEHNLFLQNLIYACVLVNAPNDKVYFRKNIVCDSLPYKVEVPLFEIASPESFMEEDNCYFLRWPDDRRKMFMFYGRGTAYIRGLGEEQLAKAVEIKPVFYQELTRVSLAKFQEKAGDTGSYTGDPKFAGTKGMTPGGTLWTGDPETMFDKLLSKPGLDFPDAFATDPKAVEKGIGLQPEAFKDFWFNKK